MAKPELLTIPFAEVEEALLKLAKENLFDHEADALRLYFDDIKEADLELDRLSIVASRPKIMRLVKRHFGFKEFQLMELKMDKDLEWTAKVSVDGKIPKVKRKYKLHLVHNSEQFDKKVEGIEQRIIELEEKPTLLTDIDNEDLNAFRESRQETICKMMDEKEQCPDISFFCETGKSEFKSDSVLLFLSVPYDKINVINEKRFMLENYILRLEEI